MCLGNHLNFLEKEHNFGSIIEHINPDMNVLKDLSCYYIDLENEYSLADFCGDQEVNVLHLNIHSFMAKRDQLLSLLCDLNSMKVKIDVILLCETFITKQNVDMCIIPDYYDYHEYRTKVRQGGVSVFIHNDYKHMKRFKLTIFVENESESLY